LGAPPGWYAAIEMDVVKPHIKNRLVAPVTVAGFTSPFGLATAELAWTVAPRFELGYRLPDELGEFVVSYRFLVSEGCLCECWEDDLVSYHDRLKSRLDLNVIDLNYAHREYGLGPAWDMKWRIGVRLANLFFDSRRTIQFTDLETDFAFQVGERVSNYFFAAGPHVGLDLWRRFGGSGLAAFGRVEGALVVGRINQGFEETFAFSDFLAVGGATSVHQTQAIPTLNVQAGLGWLPSRWPWLRFTAGYQYEHWWYVGQAGDSSAELWDQGVFLRAEYKY
jgi:hypothetical protein